MKTFQDLQACRKKDESARTDFIRAAVKEHTSHKAEIIRGSVNGTEKYCRIPIRRKRTPIYSYELEEILIQYMGDNGVDIDAIKGKALELFENNECEEAGLLCSALDFIDLFERISFVDDHR